MIIKDITSIKQKEGAIKIMIVKNYEKYTQSSRRNSKNNKSANQK